MSEVTNIKQERVIGQNAAIRKFDPNDPVDMSSLQQIIERPEVQKWMDEIEGLTIDQIKNWATKNDVEECLFAITGGEKSGFKNIGEIQGFVNVYASETVSGATEVSYAKHPDALPKQIASGLRQAIVAYNQTFLKKPEDDFPTARVIADIDENNIDSINVAAAAGFVKEGPYWELDWKKLNDKLIESSYQELGIGKK